MSDEHSATNSTTTAGVPEINAIFKVLSSLYPEFMKGKTQKEIDFTKNLWFAHLSRYQASVVRQILEQVPDRFPRWAPRLGEFKSLCIIRPEHRTMPRLEFLDGKKQLSPRGEAAREEVKNLVRAKTVTPDDSA